NETHERSLRPARVEAEQLRIVIEDLRVELVVVARAQSIAALAVVDAEAPVQVVPERAVVDAIPEVAFEAAHARVEAAIAEDAAVEDPPVLAARAIERERHREEAIVIEAAAGEASGPRIEAVARDRVEARAHRREGAEQRREGVRHELVVAVEHADEIAARFVEAAVARGGDAEVSRFANE